MIPYGLMALKFSRLETPGSVLSTHHVHRYAACFSSLDS